MTSATNQSNTNSDKPWLTTLAYLAVFIVIFIAWQLRDRQLVVASEGTGYLLGIVGTTMMVLLLLYPLRKRARVLQGAGAIKYWFQVHMMLGIVGPVLVLLHSNFNLGSLNSQVALFCTVVVSSSGILGRYLYGKVHNGLYGQRTTMADLQYVLTEGQQVDESPNSLLPLINKRLIAIENSIETKSSNLFLCIAHAIGVTFSLHFFRHKLLREIKLNIDEMSRTSVVVNENRRRLYKSTKGYLAHRLSVLRKFAQLQACEKLFSLWHVVHYPLFMVLVVAATVHVVAAHMY